jgi:hypothetical protein
MPQKKISPEINRFWPKFLFEQKNPIGDKNQMLICNQSFERRILKEVGAYA